MLPLDSGNAPRVCARPFDWLALPPGQGVKERPFAGGALAIEPRRHLARLACALPPDAAAALRLGATWRELWRNEARHRARITQTPRLTTEVRIH